MGTYKNKEWLYTEYVSKERSSGDIAKECGVNSQTVLNWLTTHSIPRRPSGTRSRSVYENTCKNCGKKFNVYSKQQHDPNNSKKFKRCCSDVCVREMKAINFKRTHEAGLIQKQFGIKRKLSRDELVRLLCYEHKTHAEICSKLNVKYSVLTRELQRLNVPREFYRVCPNCNSQYSVPIRSMADPNSNKFKKFCSRKCFLSSRKRTDTWIEVKVKDFLDEKGIDYVAQYEVDRMTLDFFIPSLNLAIEANGDFWHANPEIYGKIKPLHRIHRRVIAKDNRKAQQLTDKGIKLHVVWENDLKTRLDETLSEIEEVIRAVS